MGVPATVASESIHTARELFEGDLLRDEEILWYGKPDPQALFSRADFALIPFSILWAGFAFVACGVLLAIAILDSPVALLGVIIAGPMALMGFYITIGRFLYKKWWKRRTHYAVTSQRLLSLTFSFGRQLDAAFIDRLTGVTRDIARDGRGTLWFGNAGWWDVLLGSNAVDMLLPLSRVAVVFYDIAEAQRVYELANQLRRS
jgi:hypothetical protein